MYHKIYLFFYIIRYKKKLCSVKGATHYESARTIMIAHRRSFYSYACECVCVCVYTIDKCCVPTYV